MPDKMSQERLAGITVDHDRQHHVVGTRKSAGCDKCFMLDHLAALQREVEGLEREQVRILTAVQRSRMKHGACERPNACTACIAEENLAAILSTFKGGQVHLAALDAQQEQEANKDG